VLILFWVAGKMVVPEGNDFWQNLFTNQQFKDMTEEEYDYFKHRPGADKVKVLFEAIEEILHWREMLEATVVRWLSCM